MYYWNSNTDEVTWERPKFLNIRRCSQMYEGEDNSEGSEGSEGSEDGNDQEGGDGDGDDIFVGIGKRSSGMQPNSNFYSNTMQGRRSPGVKQSMHSSNESMESVVGDLLNDLHSSNADRQTRLDLVNNKRSKRAPSISATKLSMRAMIVDQLVSTEKKYIQHLSVVLDIFQVPMLEKAQQISHLPNSSSNNPRCNNAFASINEIRLIFGNIETLHNMHCIFLQTLLIPLLKKHGGGGSGGGSGGGQKTTSRTSSILSRFHNIIKSMSTTTKPDATIARTTIDATSPTCTTSTSASSRLGTNTWIAKSAGNVFIEFSPTFCLYREYSKLHHEAIKTLNKCLNRPMFVSFLHRCEKNKRCRGVTLESYLALPLHRLSKYQLFLQELQSHTSPNHRDYSTVCQALRDVTTNMEDIEQSIYQHEKNHQILNIQNSFDNAFVLLTPSRKYIRSDIWTCPEPEFLHFSVHTFLFNDIIILAKSKRYGRHLKYDMLTRKCISLTQVLQVSSSGDGGGGGGGGGGGSSNKKAMAIQFHTPIVINGQEYSRLKLFSGSGSGNSNINLVDGFIADMKSVQSVRLNHESSFQTGAGGTVSSGSSSLHKTSKSSLMAKIKARQSALGDMMGMGIGSNGLKY